jgi:twitching motility protein PilT
VPNLARFRVNAFVQNRGAGAVFRTIPSKVLTLEELNAPKIFKDIAEHAARHRAGHRADRFRQVDDAGGHGQLRQRKRLRPHPDRRGSDRIRARIEEVPDQPARGRAAHAVFANALRSALREDPDVILVGEMRDLETIRLALTAAETGHLVFGTLHTSSGGQDHRPDRRRVPGGGKGNGAGDAFRIAARGHFADAAQDQGRQGRVAAHEIMIGTPAIRNLIREAKIAQMYSAIQTGQNVGMQTLDQNLPNSCGAIS